MNAQAEADPRINVPRTSRPTPTIREHYGITAAVEQLLMARDVRSVAWTVDRFYNERPQAEDALSRLLEEGRLRAHNHVLRGFELLPKAIVGKLQISFE